MNVYLDDIRPAPEGFLLVTSLTELKALLSEPGLVKQLSLDHDLGACPSCMELYSVKTAEEWLARSRGTSMPNCPHIGTGLDMVRWMIVENKWSREKPTVHSMNPVGASSMRAEIDAHFPTKDE